MSYTLKNSNFHFYLKKLQSHDLKSIHKTIQNIIVIISVFKFKTFLHLSLKQLHS